MSYLNYFEPFQNKLANHEDQLTRAFLCVLKYSPSSIMIFYDLIRKSYSENARDRHVNTYIPSISELELKDIDLRTQTNDLQPHSEKLLSVLLIDEMVDPPYISFSERSAIYDAVIRFGNSITLLMENKPKGGYWPGQLCPEREDTSDETELLPVPAILLWRDILGNMNKLILLHSINGAEKLIISDFLDYVNRHFSHLNPYNTIGSCKRNEYLIQKRIGIILEEIVSDTDYIGSLRSGMKYIKTNLNELDRIAIELNTSGDEVNGLNIALYYGNTASQAKYFYGRHIPWQSFEKLKYKGWEIAPDFHLSFMSKDLVWVKSDKNKVRDYYEFWISHQDMIKQYNKDSVRRILELLEKGEIIVIDEETNNGLNKYVYDTKREKINLCPAMYLFYKFKLEDVDELDRKGNIVEKIAGLFKQGLNILQTDLPFLKE